jgi:hypothetical protein
VVSRIAKYHQDLADIGEITGKWAKFIIKLYNVNEEEGKATESLWPTNDIYILEWMKTIETKQELSPANATALTKWLQNGREVVWKGIFPPQIADIVQDIHGYEPHKCGGLGGQNARYATRRCHGHMEIQMQGSIHDTTDKVEDEKVRNRNET